MTVSTKNVSGVGTVLVNGKGQTLYLLTSEKGGKITCTASNGCTQVWPETTLPSGTTAAKAGTGVKSSLLGTVKGAGGAMEVTYNGWPLYTLRRRLRCRRGGPRPGADQLRRYLVRAERRR